MATMRSISVVPRNIINLFIQKSPTSEPVDHKPAGAICQLLLLTLPFGLFVLHTFHYIPEMVDDAFIIFRYAMNLAAGNGMVFNAGEMVEGTSAPVYTVILAAVLAALDLGPADLLDIARIIGVGSSILSMLVVYVIALKIYRLPFYVGLLILFGIALNPYFAFWSMNAMETNFHGFLLLAILAAFEYSRLGPRSAQSTVKNSLPVLVGSFSIITAGVFVVCASRPEAPAFIGAYIAYRIIDSVINRHYQTVCLWAAAGITGLLLLLAARLSYYGDLFPNTYYAKVVTTGLWREAGWQYFKMFFDRTPLLALLNVAGLIGLLLAYKRDHIIHLILIAGCFLFAYYSDGDWMFNFRFAVAAVPSYILLLVVGLFAWRNLFARLPTTFSHCASAILIAALIISWSKTFLIYRDRSYFPPDPLSSNKESLFPGYFPGDPVTPLIVYPADHVINYCHSNERVMMPDIGFPAFITDNPVLDSRGLTDHVIARSLYYGYRKQYANLARQWDDKLVESLELDPPCAVTLLPEIYYLGERHFSEYMTDDYLKIDERTYIREPANILPLASRVANWEKAWSRMPRSMLVTFSYIDALVEAGDIDALSRLANYYESKPRLLKQFDAKLKYAINSVNGV